MCEMMYLRKDTSFPLSDVLQYALILERYGLAGFGWGVAFVQGEKIDYYRSELSLDEDRGGQFRLSDLAVDACLLHLRRPSFLSTIAVRNTQPYLEPDEFAFGHNGYLEASKRWRDEQTLIGESDSEVGFVKYKSHLSGGNSRVDALQKTVGELIGDGSANVIAMHKDGRAVATGWNRMNRLWRFRGKGFVGITTEIHSPDGILFKKFFPWMTDLVQVTTAIEI